VYIGESSLDDFSAQVLTHNTFYLLHHCRVDFKFAKEIKRKKCIYGAGVEPSPLVLRPFIGLLYQPWMIDGVDCGAVSGMNNWEGKPEY
jgi:hypothetical protein